MSINEEKEIRVLTFSIDVWNKLSGSDTLSNLFSGYNDGRIANIYFKSGIPDDTKCDRYYFISESKVLKNLFRINRTNGMRVTPNVADIQASMMRQEEKRESSRYKFFSRHRLWIFQYAREFIWKFGRWNSSELKEFVNEFSPNVLFFPVEGYIYFNRITEYFMKKLQIPAIGIIWDDNFTYKVHPYNVGFLIYRFFLRKQVRRILNKCSVVYAISPKMQKELYDEFGVLSEILTKGAVVKEKQDLLSNFEEKKQRPIKIVYTGKLNIGRLDTVKVLANAIDAINIHNVLYELHVYSSTQLNEKEVQSIEKKGCCFMGSVPQDQIGDIQREADILLLVEALKGSHKNDARLSFSTKTVDYLSKGKCIFYMGTEDNATAEYLRTNDVALFASTYEQTIAVLNEILAKSETMQDYGKKAYRLAVKNHDIIKVQADLYDMINKVSKS